MTDAKPDKRRSHKVYWWALLLVVLYVASCPFAQSLYIRQSLAGDDVGAQRTRSVVDTVYRPVDKLVGILPTALQLQYNDFVYMIARAPQPANHPLNRHATP